MHCLHLTRQQHLETARPAFRTDDVDLQPLLFKKPPASAR